MEISNSVLRLQPGMYILRHSKNAPAPLSIGVAPSSPAEGRLERLATNGTQGSLLRDGADCIVVHVSAAPVDLLVSAFPGAAGEPVPTLRVDRIALDAARPADTPAPLNIPKKMPASASASAGQPLRVPGNGISMIGHIERLGESIALPGQALGDPASDLRLEGFQVMWPDHPEDLDLAYGITVEGGGPLPVVKTGKYCGTRNQARRVTEATFALIGARASRFRLEGTAHFSGGFEVPVRSGVTLAGPSGAEHLVALSIRVVPAPVSQHLNPWQDSSRTQAFRAEGNEAEAAVQGAAGIQQM